MWTWEGERAGLITCLDLTTLHSVRIYTRRSLDRHDYTHSIELVDLHIHLRCVLSLLFVYQIHESCFGVNVYSIWPVETPLFTHA
jgi:hypothetical protein